MALIIENGSGVADANSYVTAAEAVAWVEARGKAFIGDETAVEQLLLTAMDLVESFRAQFSGNKTDPEQSLQWPRTGATLDGVSLADDFIPKELKYAQIQLAYDAQTVDLQPTGTGQETLKEKVDVLEVEYAERGTGSVEPQLNKANAFLEPLFGSRGFSLRTIRV